jgi:hypothetical protein
MVMMVFDSHELVLEVDSESEKDEHVVVFYSRNPVSGKLQPVFSVGGDKEQLTELTKRISRKVERIIEP